MEEDDNSSHGGPPVVHGRDYWRTKANIEEFSSVDGDKIFWTGYNHWGVNRHPREVGWWTACILEDAEGSLIADQEERSVALEYNKFNSYYYGRKMTQVPFRE